MAEKTPLEELEAFRQIHLEERRRIVRTALELRETNKEGGLHGEQLARAQGWIEAVDRAIEDERKLKGQPKMTVQNHGI